LKRHLLEEVTFLTSIVTATVEKFIRVRQAATSSRAGGALLQDWKPRTGASSTDVAL
jgi:hypothetical protein